MPENTSQKRVLIDKANRTVFVAFSISAAILAFSIVATRSLYTLSRHQSRVISAKKEAAKQLKANDGEIGELISSFKAFEETPESVLGTTEKNSKIVLDSLPPKYDFPALAASLEKILTEGGYSIDSISGTDNELGEVDDDTISPTPVAVPFTLSVSGPYDKVRQLPVDLERSIRPIHIQKIALSGTATDAKVDIEAVTYYQPGKNLDVRYEDIK